MASNFMRIDPGVPDLGNDPLPVAPYLCQAYVLWIKLFAVNNFIHRMHFMSADYRTRATSLIRQEIDVNGRAAIAEHRLQILETVQPFAHRRP